MASSRLERFKAAIKDDLDKIPNKPKEAGLPTSATGHETIQVAPTTDDNGEVSSSSNGRPIRRVKTEYQTRFENALNSLTIDTTGLDSEDSEEDCEITIEPVDETDSTSPYSEGSAADSPLFKLGTKMPVAQVTLHGETFCPILPVAKYPYKYVPKATFQAVASSFFDSGQFWAREWDLFYVWPLESADKPIIFVREEQFAHLLREVGVKFPNLHIDPRDSYFRQIKLVTSFPDHPRMLPRYLGRSKSRDDYDKMVLRTPAQRPFAFPRDEPEPENAPTEEQVADFTNICETAADLNRAKSKSKDKKEQKVAIQATLTKQLKRAQRYFGLRKHTVKGATDPEVNLMPPLDISKPPIYELELDVVIVCIDIEAWERSHSIITEVGVATLDTRNIKDIAPGPQAENWRSKIRARHFRIREHMTYINHEFVQGAPDRFEKDFGTTEIISKKDAASIVASCFKEPFSKPQTQEEIDASWEKLSKSSDDSDAPAEEVEKRNIVFLGHNPASDVDFLRTLGYDPTTLLNLIDFMDTAGLYRAHNKEAELRSVGRILSELDIVGWNLHNAGNDAVYTMWIMLATIVAEAQARDMEKESSEVEETKTEEKVENVQVAPKRVVPNLDDYIVPEDCYTW